MDDYPEEKYPARNYFFTILNTIYPEYMEQIMTHARNMRYSADGTEKEREAIEANDEWYAELTKMPYISGKLIKLRALNFILYIGSNGKFLHLVKKKAKTIIAKKQRKKIPLLGSIGEYKDSKVKQAAVNNSQI